MKVLKFGGTSVGTPERIMRVKGIIEAQELPCVVVISAFAGVTDDLYHVSELAASGKNEYKTLLEGIFKKHRDFTTALIPDEVRQKKILEQVNTICDELSEIFRGICLLARTLPTCRIWIIILMIPAAGLLCPPFAAISISKTTTSGRI